MDSFSLKEVPTLAKFLTATKKGAGDQNKKLFPVRWSMLSYLNLLISEIHENPSV